MTYFDIHRQTMLTHFKNLSRYCISRKTPASPRISKLGICSTNFMESYVRRIRYLIQASEEIIKTLGLLCLFKFCYVAKLCWHCHQSSDDWLWLRVIIQTNTLPHMHYWKLKLITNSAGLHLWASWSAGWSAPQWDGQQLWKTLQGLPGWTERTGKGVPSAYEYVLLHYVHV